MWVPSDSSDDGDAARRARLRHVGGASPPRVRSRSRSRSRCRSRSTDSEGPLAARSQLLGLRDRAQTLPRPSGSPGTAWWVQPLHTAAEHVRLKFPQSPTRPLTHQSLLSGMMTESWALEALDIPVKTLCAVDCKPAARRWLTSVGRGRHGHLHSRLEDMTDVRAHCDIHDGRCGVDEGADLATIGLCCQPFSIARDQRAVPPRKHPLFRVTFVDFPAYVEAKHPKGFIAEQVKGFGKVDNDDEAGRTYLQQFVDLMVNVGTGYAVRGFLLDNGMWNETDRSRCPS
jgi:hypothetical protein